MFERAITSTAGASPGSRSLLHGSRRSRFRAALLGGTLLAFGAATAYGVVTTQDIRVATRAGYDVETTDEGATAEYIGDQNVTFGSSGTGTFNPFVRVQEGDDEKGYNTDGDIEFDTKGGVWTHSILVSEIPVVECQALDANYTGESGDLCWELFADLNEQDSTKTISLDAVEIYFTDDPELTGYPFGSDADLVFASDDQILINDVNQGSGRGDLRYLVPIDTIAVPSECDYGSSSCETYFVLYSEYGFTEGAYDSDGGFEEWKVRIYPFLEVTKTATTTFTRTFAWTITKSADPATWDLFDGDTGTSDWTVEVTKDAGTDSGWAVSGSITVENTSDEDAVLESVTDSISGVGAATVSCGVTFPYELDSGDTLVCTYMRSLPDGAARTNTATATLANGAIFDGDAAVTFGAPTTVVNGTVDVSDTNGMAWEDVADDDTFTYAETFECDADEGEHENTATIEQTGQSASATVTVTCYDLDVTKTADPAFQRDFDWTITKTVDPETLELFDGDSGDVEWTVEWTKSEAEDFGYSVDGEITITNNHPTLDATLTQVTDAISGIADAVTVDCPSLTVPASDSIVCTYSSDLPDGTGRTNTATATQQNHDYDQESVATASGTTDYSGTAQIDFTGVAPTVTDDEATLSDARPVTPSTATWSLRADPNPGPRRSSATLTKATKTTRLP